MGGMSGEFQTHSGTPPKWGQNCHCRNHAVMVVMGAGGGGGGIAPDTREWEAGVCSYVPEAEAASGADPFPVCRDKLRGREAGSSAAAAGPGVGALKVSMATFGGRGSKEHSECCPQVPQWSVCQCWGHGCTPVHAVWPYLHK